MRKTLFYICILFCLCILISRNSIAAFLSDKDSSGGVDFSTISKDKVTDDNTIAINGAFFLLLNNDSKGIIEPPPPPSTPIDGGESRRSRIVWFSWDGPEHVEIHSYHLQIGTSPGGSDVFDANIGFTHEYYVTGNHNQTLFARVAAVAEGGQQSEWSEPSDGIQIIDPDQLEATIYVSKGGNDNDAGSEGEPFETIAKAVSVAKEGDIISVSGGEYFEQIEILNGGSYSRPLVLRAEKGQNVIINGTSKLSTEWEDEGQFTNEHGTFKLWRTEFTPSSYPKLNYLGEYLVPLQLFSNSIQLDSRLRVLPKPDDYQNGHALTEEESQSWSRILSQMDVNSWFWFDDREDHGENKNSLGIFLGITDHPDSYSFYIPTKNTGFILNTHHVAIQGFTIKGQSLFGIAGIDLEDAMIIDNDISLLSAKRRFIESDAPDSLNHWDYGAGVAMSGRRIVIDNNTVNNTMYNGIHLSNGGKCEPMYSFVINNSISNVEPHPFGVNRGHESGQAVSGADCNSHFWVLNNHISNVKYGIWHDSTYSSPNGTGYTFAINNMIEDVGVGIHLERGSHNGLVARNVIYLAGEVAGSYDGRIGVKLGTSIQYLQEQPENSEVLKYNSKNHRIVNNTIVNSTKGILFDYATNITVKNNIIASFSTPNAKDFWGLYFSKVTVDENLKRGLPYGDIDYNLYSISLSAGDGYIGYWGDTSYSDLNVWRSVECFDINSLVENPHFIDTDAKNVGLLESSPAINRGIDVGLSDYSGIPDIGAIEYIP